MDCLQTLSFPAVPQTGNPSVPSIVFTSHLLLRQGGDWAHGSEVMLLTERTVGMLTETLVPVLPAGIAAQ